MLAYQIRRGRRRRFGLLAGAASMLVMPQAVMAQADASAAWNNEAAGEIIVTATRREESAQDLPQSLAVLDGTLLEDLGAVGLQDISRLTPGLNFTTGRHGNNRISLRGISSPQGGAPQENAAVGFYIDDVPVSDANFSPDLGLFDLQRIEVLKGPQGTLFGEGSIGGTVRLVTSQPVLGTFDGKAEGVLSGTRRGGANYKLAAALNVPIDDKVALRVVGERLDQEGFVDNLTTGAANINDMKRWTIRGALTAALGETVSMTASVFYQDSRYGAAAFDTSVAGTDPSYRSPFREFGTDEVVLAGLTVEADLDFATLVANGSHYDRSNFLLTNNVPFLTLFAPAVVGPLAATFTRGAPQRNILDTKADTLEARLVSNGSGALQWVAGTFYRNRRGRFVSQQDLPDFGPLGLPTFVSQTIQQPKLKQIAVYGQADLEVVPGLTATLGARGFSEKLTGTNQPFRFRNTAAPGRPPALALVTLPSVVADQKVEKLLLRGALSYAFNEDVRIYANFAQGYRAGGINEAFEPGLLPATFGPETADTYEVGIKTNLFDRRLLFNVAMFLIDWKNLQTVVFTPTTPPRTFIGNAGKARSQGVELELSWRPTDSVLVGGSHAYTDATIRNAYLSAPNGARLANSAKHSFNLYAQATPQLTADVTGYARIDWSSIDDRFAALQGIGLGAAPPGTSPVIPANRTLSVRVGGDYGKFSLRVFADNLLDRRNVVGLAEWGTRLIAQPRTIGVQLGASF
jgi:iron complex outermembrane recepter protein